MPMNAFEQYTVKKVTSAKPIEVSVPGSKSITNRALLIAALSNGTSVLDGVLFSDDSRHFLQALIDLGFSVDIDEANARVTVTGCGGRIPKKGRIHVGSAGTAARFLTAYLGLSEGNYFIDSSEQMKKRPMKELLDALTSLGAHITYKEEAYHFPLEIGCNAWTSDEVTIDVDKSSQFLSALLIVSVLSAGDFTIHVTGSHGMSYVAMTVRMMEQFGVQVNKPDKNTFVIPKGQHYLARHYAVEPDLSAACYFYAMSPLLGVTAKVRGVHAGCMQGDIQFLDVLRQMGCDLVEAEDGMMVFPPKGDFVGGCFDLSGFSDQALTLAAIAPFAKTPVTIQKIGHIRLQECDRMHAIEENLKALGIKVDVTEDSVTITPGEMHGAMIHTFEDHRVAMAFSLPGLCQDGVVIENPSCCRKTFENYFDVLGSIY